MQADTQQTMGRPNRTWSQREAAVSLKLHSGVFGGCLPWLTLGVRKARPTLKKGLPRAAAAAALPWAIIFRPSGARSKPAGDEQDAGPNDEEHGQLNCSSYSVAAGF